jgi:hypothetical protein
MRRWITLIFLLVLLLIIGRLVGPRLAPRSTDDEIHLSNNSGHLAVIVLDSKRVDCQQDEILRTTDTVAVGNVLSPGACDSRIAVLVQERAMHFAEGGLPWTDGLGDSLNVALVSMPQLPISIWVPTGGSGDAKTHFNAAGPFYSNMQTGVGFEDSAPIVEVEGLVSLTASCANLGPVTAVGKDRGRLNIYYVQEITDELDARGVHCSKTDPDVILISTAIGVTATLSHEIGHALTLEHTNEVDGLNEYTEQEPGLAVCNLMLRAAVNQKLLSTGQGFRCNLNGDSAINRLGVRTGLTPGCHWKDKTAECPALALDVQPK